MECNSLLESATTTSTSGITANIVIKMLFGYSNLLHDIMQWEKSDQDELEK